MKELNPTEIWGPHDEDAGEMPKLDNLLKTPAPWDTPRKPRPITFDRAIILLAVLLSAAGLLVALTHGGPRGLTGPAGVSGPAGQQGATGPAGTSPYDPYDKVCSLSGMLYQGSYITGYYPCSNVNPNG